MENKHRLERVEASILQRVVFSSLLFVLSSFAALAQAEKPREPIKPGVASYEKLAFYPERWRKADVPFQMLAWEGEEVVLLTKKGVYDAAVITAFVDRLDAGWKTYRELIGAEPRSTRTMYGKPTICALPRADLSCGYGCGYIGQTGIEVSAFHQIDLPAFEKQPDGFQHYYFYEMGRNYFVFGDRHSLFQTGYAVFMRYVCMDALACVDGDPRTRKTIEACEDIYAKSELKFFDTFTNLGNGEKRNRLAISPSDQPVMYATAMLKLRKDYGGDAWTKRFFHNLRKCKAVRATSVASAKTQCYNWLVCASVAAQQDLSVVFADRWRMPLSTAQRKLMKAVDWKNNTIEPGPVVERLMKAG